MDERMTRGRAGRDARVRRWAAAVLVVLLGASRAEAYAIKGCFGDTSSDASRITRTMVENLPRGATSWPCFDEECRARRDIACAANALSHRLTPNTMAYPTRAEADRYWRGYGRVLLAFGRAHPRRNPIYCRLLAQVAGRITGQEDENDWTANFVTELAILADRPGSHCAQGVMAAMPDVESVRKDRAGWTQWCLPDVQLCQRRIRRDIRRE